MILIQNKCIVVSSLVRFESVRYTPTKITIRSKNLSFNQQFDIEVRKAFNGFSDYIYQRAGSDYYGDVVSLHLNSLVTEWNASNNFISRNVNGEETAHSLFMPYSDVNERQHTISKLNDSVFIVDSYCGFNKWCALVFMNNIIVPTCVDCLSYKSSIRRIRTFNDD